MAKKFEDVKQAMLARLGEMKQQLEKMATEKVSDDQVQDPGDQALTSTMETLRSSLQDAELAEFNRIVQALEKIDNGTYGICIDCGNEISPKRLSSYPNAARCLACQEIYEDRESL